MDRVLEVFLSIFYVHAQVCVDIVISLQYALRDMTDSYKKRKKQPMSMTHVKRTLEARGM